MIVKSRPWSELQFVMYFAMGIYNSDHALLDWTASIWVILEQGHYHASIISNVLEIRTDRKTILTNQADRKMSVYLVSFILLIKSYA